MTTMSRAVSPALIVLALVVMMLPTWRTYWSGPTPESLTIRWLRWPDLLILGYADPFPLLSVLCTALALVLALLRWRRGHGGIALAVCLGLAAAAAVLGGLLFDGLAAWGLAVPGLLLLSLLLVALDLRRARGGAGFTTQSRNGSSPHSGNTALRAD